MRPQAGFIRINKCNVAKKAKSQQTVIKKTMIEGGSTMENESKKKPGRLDDRDLSDISGGRL